MVMAATTTLATWSRSTSHQSGDRQPIAVRVELWPVIKFPAGEDQRKLLRRLSVLNYRGRYRERHRSDSDNAACRNYSWSDNGGQDWFAPFVPRTWTPRRAN